MSDAVSISGSCSKRLCRRLELFPWWQEINQLKASM